MYSRNVIFWSFHAGILLFGIMLITLGLVIPDLRVKTGMDEVSSGAPFPLMQFGILAGSMIFSPVVDKYSYRMLRPPYGIMSTKSALFRQWHSSPAYG